MGCSLFTQFMELIHLIGEFLFPFFSFALWFYHQSNANKSSQILFLRIRIKTKTSFLANLNKTQSIHAARPDIFRIFMFLLMCCLLCCFVKIDNVVHVHCHLVGFQCTQNKCHHSFQWKMMKEVNWFVWIWGRSRHLATFLRPSIALDFFGGWNLNEFMCMW